MSPLISIIVPFYNCEDVIRENIESLQNQTLKDIELIYVDDASEDSSLSIVSEYSKHDGRIRLVKVPHKGAGAARNVGMSYAKGEYLLFLDADDYFSRELCEQTYKVATKYFLDICICGAQIVDENLNQVYSCGNALQEDMVAQKSFFSPRDLADNLFQFTGPFVWNKLYRRDYILREGVTFQELWSINDLYFTYYTLSVADRIGICRKQLVYYRIREGKGLTQNNDNEPFNICLAIDKLRDAMLQRNIFDFYEKTFCKSAGGEFLEALDRMRTIDTFCNLFNQITDIYFPKYAIYNKDKSFFLNDSVFDLITKMKNSDAYTFLFLKRQIDKLQQKSLNVTIEELHSYIKERDRFIEERDAAIAKLLIINSEKHWIFSEENYPQGIKFVIYGYGKVGKDYARQLANSKHSNLVAVIDKNYDTIDEPYLKNIKVGNLSILSDIVYDYIIISPRKEEIAKEIKSELISVGIPEEKIICPVLDEMKEDR